MWTLPKIQQVSDIFPCVPDMMVSDSDLNSQASELASQYMWRSKDSQPRTWLTRLKQVPWVQVFITRTLKPSHSESFEDALISYLVDSPANLSVKPGGSKGTKILGTFSPISLKESSSPNPLWSSLKTSKELSPPSSKATTGEIPSEHPFCSMSLESWKGWVTKQRQSRRARQKSVLLTSETDGSLSAWPTVCVGEEKYRIQGKSQASKCLSAMAARGELSGQPDPAKNNSEGSRPESSENTKKDTTCKKQDTKVIESWETATVSRGGHTQKDGSVRPKLDQQVKENWPTVASAGVTGGVVGLGGGAGAKKTLEKQIGREEVLKMTCAKLNPRWVETLMGLKVGWTMPSCANPVTIVPMSSDCLETESSLSPLPKPSSEGCLNWGTPNVMDCLPPKSDETLRKQATGIRKGRSRPANLREQVDDNALKIYEEENNMAMRKNMRTSASQITTAHDCLLKWWFNSVARLPQKFDRKKLIGSVGHEVLERYQLGEEMYPKGWTSPTSRFTGLKEPHHITTTEQALVKTLVNSAINSNKVRREPDGEVEKEFGKELGVIAEIEGVKVTLLGFIDYFYGNNVDDHKFTGAAKYYGKTALSKAIPMNLYAWAGYKEGWLNHPTVWLRYNIFVKNIMKPEVKIVHVEKTQDEINDFYDQHIEPLLKPMVLARKNCTTWDQVDSAMARGKAETTCNKYNGCEYMDICLGKCTMETYIKRFEEGSLEDKKSAQSGILDRLTNGTTTSRESGNKEIVMSGFLKKMTAGEGAGEASAGAPVVAKVVETAPETVAVSASVEQTSAPWAFDACPVCKRNLADGKTTVRGLSAEGSESPACNICVMTTDDAKESNPDQPVLADFEVAVGDDGTVTWSDKEQVVIEAVVVKEEPKVSETVAQKGEETFKDGLLPDASEEEKAPVAAKEPVASGSQIDPLDKTGFNQDKTGSRGFTLSYTPVRSKLKKSSKLGEANCVVHITELSELIGIKLLVIANQGGAAEENWKSVPYFTRKDMIAHNALPIAEMVGNSIIDASGMIEASDEHVVCSQIERYASILVGSIK